jgi:hypothetical protein
MVGTNNYTTVTRVSVTTLDHFASRHGLWVPPRGGSGRFAGPGIDVLKIDAEGVDAKVLAGAAGLFAAGMVTVVVWEMPISLPVTFDPVASAAIVAASAAGRSGGNSPKIKASSTAVVVRTLKELVAHLSEVAELECYMPGKRGLTLSLRHWHEGIENGMFGRLNRGNALCASRVRAPEMVAALNARSLALMSEDILSALVLRQANQPSRSIR